jgi:hypothetical protein
VLCPLVRTAEEGDRLVRRPRWLETVHAADELGFSPRTLEGWRRRGEGPPYLKFGRRVKYRLEDIEAFKAAQLHAKPGAARHG